MRAEPVPRARATAGGCQGVRPGVGNRLDPADGVRIRAGASTRPRACRPALLRVAHRLTHPGAVAGWQLCGRSRRQVISGATAATTECPPRTGVSNVPTLWTTADSNGLDRPGCSDAGDPGCREGAVRRVHGSAGAGRRVDRIRPTARRPDRRTGPPPPVGVRGAGRSVRPRPVRRRLHPPCRRRGPHPPRRRGEQRRRGPVARSAGRGARSTQLPLRPARGSARRGRCAPAPGAPRPARSRPRRRPAPHRTDPLDRRLRTRTRDARRARGRRRRRAPGADHARGAHRGDRPVHPDPLARSGAATPGVGRRSIRVAAGDVEPLGDRRRRPAGADVATDPARRGRPVPRPGRLLLGRVGRRRRGGR